MQYTSEEIVAGLRDQSPEVIDYLYANYWQSCIYDVCEKGGREEDGEDVFQISLMKLIEKIRTGGYQGGGVIGYFKGILRYTWKNLKRRKDKMPQTPLAEDLPDPMEQSFQRFRMAELTHRYLEELRPGCQEIMKAVYWNSLPQKEIADELGYTHNSFRTTLHKCRKQLFELLCEDSHFHHLTRSS